MYHTTEKPSIGDSLHTFKEGIKKPTFNNYKTTLQAGLDLLQQSTSDHSYPVLQGIFESCKDYNDLISKIEIYLCTNTSFKYYRYSKHDKTYSEPFNLDFSKHDIRSLLILIRCYNISKGSISKPVQELIEALEYIDEVKDKKSLETLKKDLPGISPKYIENRYKDKKYTISQGGELAKMINANLYLLSYDHEGFTQSKKDGRIYNSFTSLNRVYRENELAFQLGEFDISSANPQIIDKVFNFNNWRNVYSNLQKTYGISRNQAKVKFNSTINNYKLSFDQAKKVYLNSGYSESEAGELAKFTAKSTKGNVYRLMARKEGEIIKQFIDDNFKNIPCIRLHDAVYYEPEFHELTDVQYNGVSFGHDAITKEYLNLDLKLNTYRTVLTTPPESKSIFKRYFNKNEAKEIHKGKNFTFYDRDFKLISATFNINKPIISKDGVYSKPTEKDFLERLNRLYISLYYLNEDTNIFYKCVEHIHDQEGIEFNKSYVYEYFKNYSFKSEDVKKYIKNRDWVYIGSGVIESLQLFNELYFSEKRDCINGIDRKKLINDLKELKRKLHQDQLHHIDKNNYHYANRFESGGLIDEIHDLLGTKRKDGIDNFNKGVSLILHPIDNNNIGCRLSDTKIKKMTIREIKAKAKVSQAMATKIKNIFSLRRTHIQPKINIAIVNLENGITKNILQQQIKEKSKTITPDQYVEKQTNKRYKEVSENGISKHAQEAFDYPIQYTGSVFDVSREYAINMSKQFFKEWWNHQSLKYLMFVSKDLDTGQTTYAKRGLTRYYDNGKLKNQSIASRIYDNYEIEKAS